MTNKEELLRQLTEELDRATAHFREVQGAEIEIIAEAPSGVPLPDGKQRVIQSAKEVRLAFEEYRRVLQRYRAFVADGRLTEEGFKGDATEG